MTTIVYSYYCLDILHIGHLTMIKKCRQVAGQKGLLIAGILTEDAIKEKKPPAVLSFEERFEIASSIKYFDQVIPQETYSPLDNLKMIKPNILMESSNHSKKDIDLLENYMKSINGEVIKVPYYSGQSSTKIKNLILKRTSI